MSDSMRNPDGQANGQDGPFATLHFERVVDAPSGTLWELWTAPAARAIWASPARDVRVEFLEAQTRVGGRQISSCRVDGSADMRCEAGWLDLVHGSRTVNYEVVSQGGVNRSAALVTATISGSGETSRLHVTVQLSSLEANLEAGYREGFGATLDNLSAAAERTMVLERVIMAPRAAVWNAWMNPETLPRWWGADGFSCRTSRMDLRSGGEWVFDMIAPDGTVFPNHHLYHDVIPQEWFSYSLLWGENGPKHADAWASFGDVDGGTRVRLCMVFSSAAEFMDARGFGAIELGHQTLGKLDRLVTGG